MEFSGATTDEHPTGSGFDAFGDVLREQIHVDLTGGGERGYGEEQDAVQHFYYSLFLCQSLVSWPSMRRHSPSGFPSAMALGSKHFGVSW